MEYNGGGRFMCGIFPAYEGCEDGQVYLFQLLLNIHMLVSRFGLFHFYSNETGSLTDECDLLGKYIMKIVVYQGDDFDELVSQCFVFCSIIILQ